MISIDCNQLLWGSEYAPMGWGVEVLEVQIRVQLLFLILQTAKHCKHIGSVLQTS